MKKIICFISVLICILSVMTAVHAEGVNISLPSETEAVAGGTVTVNIDISGNTGIALGKVRLNFDKNVLTPISVEKKDVLQSVVNFQSNIDDPQIDPSELDFVTVSWISYSTLTDNGTLAAVTFAILDNASGTSNLMLTVEEIADITATDVTASVTNGTVKISGGKSEETSGDKIDVAMAANNINKTTSTISGTMSLSVYSSKSNNASFIFCIYDSDGCLIAVNVKKQELAEGSNSVALDSLSAPVNKIGTYAVKVYTWDELEKMIPLTDEPVMFIMQ